jgi:hypothetical protein
VTDPNKLEEVKLAADFLFSSQCYADSFALYILVVKQLKEVPKQEEWTTISAIMKCAQSAVTASQIEIMLNLLKQKLSEQSVYAVNTAEAFLYRSALEYVYRMQGDDDAACQQHRLAMESNFVQQKSLTSLPAEKRAFSVVLYRYLNRAITSKGHFINARSLKEELIHSIPGPFEYESDLMRNGSVRCCLHWCISALESVTGLGVPRMDLRGQLRSKRLANFLMIFGNLWRFWQLRKTHPEVKVWADQAEQTMGISPSDLLGTTCLWF